MLSRFKRVAIGLRLHSGVDAGLRERRCGCRRGSVRLRLRFGSSLGVGLCVSLVGWLVGKLAELLEKSIARGLVRDLGVDTLLRQLGCILSTCGCDWAECGIADENSENPVAKRHTTNP